MLQFEGLNYMAVVVAWIINCAVGALWYSPMGFAKQWAKLTGQDIMEIPQNEATKILGFVVVSGLLQAATLAVVIHSLGAGTASQGAQIGLLLWLGLTAATTIGVTLYQRLGWKFWWLNASYFLVVMLVNSVLLAVWR